MAPKGHEQEFSDEEAERRTVELIKRARSVQPKSLKDFVGTTPRAKAMARRRRSKSSPKS